ncbi:MAG: hypothetical protein ABIK38_02120 [candidate division WOR-3 bacterium]
MRKNYSLLIPILMLGIAGIVYAQHPDKVRQELERTDDIIRQAGTIVEPSNNSEAQLLLNQAIVIQQTAWDGYRRRRYRWSYSRTLAARQRAREAMELITVDPQRIAAEIERTNELMSQLRPQITRIDDPQIADLWKTVQTEQNAALNYLHTRRWRWALRFTMAARNHIYEIMGKLGRFQSWEKIQSELNRTDLILQRISGPVAASHNFRAQEMFSRAGEWQVQAKNRFRSRMYLVTVKLTFAARELAMRAWQLVTQTPDSTLVSSALEETEHLIVQWEERVNQQQDARIKEMLNLAIKQQNAARELYRQRDLNAALEQTNQARQMLYRIVELLNLAEPPAGKN